MELLYLIDRLVTGTIQALSKLIERGLHLSQNLQKQFLLVPYLLAVLVHVLITGQKSESMFSSDLLLIISLFAFLVFGGLLVYITSLFLKKLHQLIDPERAFSPEKDYEDGYAAWGYAFSGFLFIATDLVIGNVHPILPIIGLLYLVSDAPKQFIDRKKSNTRRKGFLVSQALQKLIEKCKEWLPKQPAPSPGV